MTTDVGLLLLRSVLATVLFIHATQKWWGWFNGLGLDRMTPVFERLGQRPARVSVRVAALCELTAAFALASGVLTLYAAALAATMMLVAGLAQCLAARSVAAARGGGEYPLFLGASAAGIGLLGPGTWSVDHALGWPLDPRALWWSMAVSVVAPVLAAVPPTLRTRAILAAARRTPARNDDASGR
jgi:putative oxidoreductase